MKSIGRFLSAAWRCALCAALFPFVLVLAWLYVVALFLAILVGALAAFEVHIRRGPR